MRLPHGHVVLIPQGAVWRRYSKLLHVEIGQDEDRECAPHFIGRRIDAKPIPEKPYFGHISFSH